MDHLTLREVFGVEDRSFNWGQVAMLFNAFLFSTLIFWYWLLIPLEYGPGFVGPAITLFRVADILSFLVLTLLLFRFIPSIPVVLVLSAAIHAPFELVYFHFVFGVPHETVEMLGLPKFIISKAIYWILLLGVIGLALRFIKRSGVALVTGAILGGLSCQAMWWLIDPSYIPSWSDLVTSLVQPASLGLLLWVGLHLTRKRSTPVSISRLSRSRVLTALTGTAGLGIYLAPSLFYGFFEQVQRGNATSTGMILAAAALILGIGGAVVWWVFVYRMWASIPDDYARMTPGKAVGLSFIPAFNIYWIFPVFRGFAKDFNRLIAQRSLDIRPLPVALFTAFPILLIASAVFSRFPVVYLPLWWSWYFILLAIVAKSCDAINALPETDHLAD